MFCVIHTDERKHRLYILQIGTPRLSIWSKCRNTTTIHANRTFSGVHLKSQVRAILFNSLAPETKVSEILHWTQTGGKPLPETMMTCWVNHVLPGFNELTDMHHLRLWRCWRNYRHSSRESKVGYMPFNIERLREWHRAVIWVYIMCLRVSDVNLNSGHTYMSMA